MVQGLLVLCIALHARVLPGRERLPIEGEYSLVSTVGLASLENSVTSGACEAPPPVVSLYIEKWGNVWNLLNTGSLLIPLAVLMIDLDIK